MVFTQGPSAHLRSLATLTGFGTIFRSSGIACFVQGGVVKTFRCATSMDSASDIASAILALPQRNRSGTLRMFGDWFGRPMDNVHNVVDTESDGDTLILTFKNNETLTIWNPSGYSTVGYTIRIADADRVRWEWYYYGREQTPENLLFHDYAKQDGGIAVSRSHGSDNPGASAENPAVELIGL